jgi:hypothetical protein
MVGIALGALGIARLLRRWRGGGGAPGGGSPGGRKDGEGTVKDGYDAQLDDELKDLDD